MKSILYPAVGGVVALAFNFTAEAVVGVAYGITMFAIGYCFAREELSAERSDSTPLYTLDATDDGFVIREASGGGVTLFLNRADYTADYYNNNERNSL